MASIAESEDTKLLRSKGLRATPHRVELLRLVRAACGPVGAPELAEEIRGMDVVTLYRGLETFAEVDLVRRVDLRHGHADFEFVPGIKHHHHIVCVSCGAIEEIPCPDPAVERKALAASKEFALISDHSLELFGECNACVSIT